MNSAPATGQSIDFSPLRPYRKPEHHSNLFMAVLLGGSLVIALVWDVVSVGRLNIDSSGWLLGIIFIFIFFAALIYLMYQEVTRYTINNRALQMFASRNGFRLDATYSPTSRPGILFTKDETSPWIADHISGRMQGLPFSFYRQSLFHDDKLSIPNYTVMEFTLPRHLPHMVIDSTIADIHTLPFDFDESQKINLEGDFYKYFALRPGQIWNNRFNCLGPRRHDGAYPARPAV